MNEVRSSTSQLSNYGAAAHYNYPHFRGRMLKKDMKLAQQPEGARAGEKAPDFELQDIDGRRWRLSELRGQPVVLIFGSGTCPLTAGGLPGLEKLYRELDTPAQWLLVYIREAHPGEDMPAHLTMQQKTDQARRLRDDEQVPWPVLVDQLDGEVHKHYGLQPNAVYLIDADGKVAFRGDMAHAPTLRDALLELREQDWRGPLRKGEDHAVHMMGSMAYGWRGIERGGEVAKQDVRRHAPPLAMNLWAGSRMKPMLRPLADRSEHLPAAAKAGMMLGAAAVAFGAFKAMRGKPH